MDDRALGMLGLIGPLVAYVFIGISIALSPWFSWGKNALSDLGHASRSNVAPCFNFGLASAGLLLIIYSVTVFRKHAKHTSLCLAVSAFLLQLVAVFDEIYGSLHRTVSVLFFVSTAATSIAYAIERRSLLTVISFIIGLSSWMLYETGVYRAGVAVPEIVSATAVTLWIASSALRIYRAATVRRLEKNRYAILNASADTRR